MRLIDADAAVVDNISCYYGAQAYLEDVQEWLDEQPTIDPEELRPKGRWVKDGNFLICLNCESEIDNKNSLGVENRRNYCPNCGAKMEET